MKEFSFSYPMASLFFVLNALMVVFLMWTWQRKARIYKGLAEQSLLPKIGHFPSKKWFWIKGILLTLAFVFFIFALGGPRGNPHYVAKGGGSLKDKDLRRKEHEVSFFLDVSSSMTVKDMRHNKTRLENAKEIMEEIIKGLKGESVSLYIFTTDVEKLVPPTVDTFYTRLVLRNAGPNVIGSEGTDITKVISKIVSEAAKLSKGKKATYIMLTDGESTEGGIPENVDFKKEMGLSELFIIGMGTKEGGVVPDVKFKGENVVSKRNDEAMEKLIRGFSGSYYVAENSSPLLIAEKILREIPRDSSATKQSSSKIAQELNELRFDEYFRYPLVLGLLLYILALTLPFYTRQEDD